MADKKPVKKQILSDLVSHIIFTYIICAWTYSQTHNFWYVSYIVIGGVMIDLDHLIDHYLYYGHTFRIRDFLSATYLVSGKVYIFLHSWELIFLMLAASVFLKSTGLFLFSLASLIHLLIDNFQRENTRAYLFTYRYFSKFDAKVILPEYRGVYY